VRKPVKPRSFMDVVLNRPSPAMQQFRDITAAKNAFETGRVKPLGTSQQDRFAANDAEEAATTARTTRPKNPSFWDAGREGVAKLKNKVLGRSMLRVERDTMRLNKAVNNAFRKSKKKDLSKAKNWWDNPSPTAYRRSTIIQDEPTNNNVSTQPATEASTTVSPVSSPRRSLSDRLLGRNKVAQPPKPKPFIQGSSDHQTLGVTADASLDEIKTAYRRLAKLSHPDNKETGNQDLYEKQVAAFKKLESGNKPATSATGPLHAAGPIPAPKPVGATVSPGLKPGANTATKTVAKLEPSPEIKPPTDSISDFEPVTQRPASAGSQILQGLENFNGYMAYRRSKKPFGQGASQHRPYDRTGKHLADSSLLRAFQRSLSKARRDYNELVTNNVVPQDVEGTAKEDTGYKQFTGRTLTSAARHHARYVAPYQGLGVKREIHAMAQGSIGIHQPLTAKVVLRNAKTRHKNNQLPVQRVYSGSPKDITFSGKPGDDT
jgi:hypothetical protein